MTKKTISAGNAVWNSGKDGYHFSKMQKEHCDREIICAMEQDIKQQYPGIRTSDAFRKAVNEFEYLTDQSEGHGRCQRVRKRLNNETQSADSIVGILTT